MHAQVFLDDCGPETYRSLSLVPTSMHLRLPLTRREVVPRSSGRTSGFTSSSRSVVMTLAFVLVLAGLGLQSAPLADALDVLSSPQPSHFQADGPAVNDSHPVRLAAGKSSASSRTIIVVLAVVVSVVGLAGLVALVLYCRRLYRRRHNTTVMMQAINSSARDSVDPMDIENMGHDRFSASSTGYTQLRDAPSQLATAGVELTNKGSFSALRQSASPSVSVSSGSVQVPGRQSVAGSISASGSSSRSNGRPTLSMNDFDPIHVLGEGSFGKVLLVRSKATGKQFAMKILKKQRVKVEGQVERTRAERFVLERLNCPYIVKLHGSFQSEDKLYFVLDYHPGGDLYYLLSRSGCFPENHLRYYASNIIVALEHLHANNVIYRDLKPENILIAEDGRAVLTDFGLCKDFQHHVQLPSPNRQGQLTEADGTGEKKTMNPLPGYQAWAESFVGTPEYLAPEIILGHNYGPSCDFYALGVTLFELATGQPPFYHTDALKLYRFTLHGTVRYPETMSPTLQNLLASLLERDPARRLGTRGGAKEVMQHPFFASVDWDAVRAHRVQAPYRPSVSSTTENVDARFAEMPVFSVEQPNGVPSILRGEDRGDDDGDVKLSSTFEGFTYRGEAFSDLVKDTENMY